MVNKEFIVAKERALKSLEKAASESETDEEILTLLKLINGINGCYTSSSCAGRTVLLEIPRIGDKIRAKSLGKWHRLVSLDDIKKALENAEIGLIWLLAQSPVIHIGCVDISIADKLLKTAIASGFKHSGLKSTRRKIILEVCSTERLDAPIGKDGVLFCNEKYLKLLIDISNEVLEASQTKNLKFEVNLRQNFS